MKKDGKGPPALHLTENPDILATIAARRNDRPSLVVGFAAETEKWRQCPGQIGPERLRLILANDVSPGTGTFGGDSNTIHLVDRAGVERIGRSMTKREVADRLAERIAATLNSDQPVYAGVKVELKILDTRLPGWVSALGSELAAGLICTLASTAAGGAATGRRY